MRNEKPASLRVPFEKTKAWRRRSGTTRTRGATAPAAFVTGTTAGAAPIRWAAANVNAAVAKSQTTVRASKRGTNEPIAVIPSAGSRRNSTPRCGEVDDLVGGNGGAVEAAGRTGGAADHREDRIRRRIRLDGVEPAEGGARKGLEPGLVLRVPRRRLELKMEVRAFGMAGVADEADGLPGGEGRTWNDGGLEIGQMAVGPGQ